MLKGCGKLQAPGDLFTLDLQACMRASPKLGFLAKSHVQGCPAAENKQPLKAPGFLCHGGVPVGVLRKINTWQLLKACFWKLHGREQTPIVQCLLSVKRLEWAVHA